MYKIFLVYLPWRKKENLLKDSYKQSSAACGYDECYPSHRQSNSPALLTHAHRHLCSAGE